MGRRDNQLPDFRARAACATSDPELFFPHPGQRRVIGEAKKVCGDCPMVDRCLTWALKHGEAGIWGGTTDTERRTLRRKGRAA